VYGLGKGLGLSLFRLAGGILTGGLDAHFYFVIVIVQFYFLTPLTDRISSRWPARGILLISWCVNLVYVVLAYSFSWYSKCFARYLVCYMLGICAGKQYDRFAKWLQNKRHIIFITYLLLLAGELYAAWSIRFSSFPVMVQQLINFMYNPVAVCAFYCLCLKGKQWGLLMHSRGLSLINRHSYGIFLYHILINYFGDLLAKKMELSLLPAVVAMRVIWCGFWIWILICIGELSQRNAQKKER